MVTQVTRVERSRVHWFATSTAQRARVRTYRDRTRVAADGTRGDASSVRPWKRDG
jgi:hypothetical protein